MTSSCGSHCSTEPAVVMVQTLHDEIYKERLLKTAAGILSVPADFPGFRFWIYFMTVVSLKCFNLRFSRFLIDFTISQIGN